MVGGVVGVGGVLKAFLASAFGSAATCCWWRTMTTASKAEDCRSMESGGRETKHAGSATGKFVETHGEVRARLVGSNND